MHLRYFYRYLASFGHPPLSLSLAFISALRKEVLFQKRFSTLSVKEIDQLGNSIPSIKEVVNLKSPSAYSYFHRNNPEKWYCLFYVTSKYDQLEGVVLELNPNLKSRSILTSLFADYIFDRYSEMGSFDLFHLFELLQDDLFKRAKPPIKPKKPIDINLLKLPFPKPPIIDGKTSFIYIIQNLRNNYYKIGYSKNPLHREQTLQSEEPEIKLISFKPGELSTEKELHKMFNAKHIRGEWFDLTLDDIRRIEKHIVSRRKK